MTTKKNTKRKQAPRAEAEAEAEVEDELSGLGAEQTQTTRPRKHKAHAGLDEIAEEDPKSRKKYAQLEVKTKRIPQEQIDTWPQVSSHVLEQIEAVIRDAKKDIANTQRDERKVMAAHDTLNPLVRKLTRQLAASRIPPQAKDIHFNIDKLTERNAQLSREVTTARHSKQLLSEQAKVAERMLEKDEEQLEQLKKDAKKWRTEWKHQEKYGRVSSSCLPK
jgi:chromosome segregation ATPase